MKSVKIVWNARLSLIAISVILVLSIVMGNTAIYAQVLLNTENSTSVRGAIDEDFVPIGTTEELKKIGTDDDYPLSGKYRLTADVSMDQMIAGEFSGVFDGNGYTVDLSISNNSWDEGLFQTLSGTVENLITTGYVTRPNGASGQTGAIVGCLSGGTVRNCWNKANVSNGWEGNAGISGMLGGGTIINCYNTGTISGAGRAGGIANSNTGAFTITNCYSSVCPTDGYYIVGGELQWSDPKIIENCYYFGDADRPGESHDWNSTVQGAAVKLTGEAITDPASYTGWDFENTWKMGANGPELIFEHVYYVEVTNGTADKRWAAEGDAVTVTADVPSGYSFAGWDGANGVTFTDGGAETATATFSVYSNVALTAAVIEEGNLFAGKGTESQPYLIRSAGDWDVLAESVLSGQTYANKYFKLTDDISVTQKIGSADITSKTAPVYAFSGIFDGDGHTLDFNPAADSSANYVAPFSIVKNAVIRNLKVTGKITANNNLSGLVGSLQGTLLAENILSEVNVTGSFVGGLIGHGSAGDITLRSCVFAGDLKGDTVAGGLICWRGPTQWDSLSTSAVHMESCLFAGTASGSADFHPIGFTQQTNVTSGFSNMWASADGKNNGKGFYNYQYQGASYKSASATVTNDSISSAARPWMGYYDVTYFAPVEGTLASALSAWPGHKTLALLGNVTTSSTITVPSGAHTLDLNGHTIKAGSSGYSVITVGSGSNTIIDDTSDKVGVITGGSAGQNYGGGVTVDGGMLTLKNGAIKGNTNTYNGIGNCGGGIHVRNGGTFIMEGGEISDNSSYVGGGVCADSSATTVSIIGGVIKNNKTDRFGSAVWAGKNSSAVFRIGGNAQIIDNISTWTADKDGEGTINFASALLVSGDPTVHGNWKTSGNSAPNTHINLDNVGNAIQIVELEGALTNDTGAPKITITPLYRWNDMANGKSFVFTKNWSKYMGDADPAEYFVCGNPAYKVFLNDSGEAEVGTPPAARITKGETSTKYGTFSDALNAWTEGSTLKLMSDVTTSSTITVPSGEHTLDLNGFNITRTGANGNDNSGLVIIVENGANLTVTGPGKITGGGGFHGGGIHVAGGSSSLVLDNCEISGNNGHYGGGLFLKEGTVTLKNGAVVKDNFASEGYGGPGIYAEGGGTLILEDCTFTGNRMNNGNQCAVFLCGNAKAQISGAPVIYDNTYNGEQKNLLFFQAGDQQSKIIFTGALTEGAKIGVRQTNYFGAITDGWNDKMGNAEISAFFKSDNDDLMVVKNGSGELELIDKNTVAFVTAGNNNSYYTDFSSAVTAWLNSTDGAILQLYKDVTYNNNIILTDGKTRVFDLNGKTYTRAATGDGTVFDVNSGANFTLTDTSEEQTGVVTRESGDLGGTVLFTRDSGSVINFNGGTITGFTSRIVITWQGSTVNMSGGEISGNSLVNGDTVDGIVRTYSNTNEAGGTFNMTGGRIVNNTLGSGKTGGAVYVGNNGTFIISGDVEISGNTQDGNPVNVYLPTGKAIVIGDALTDGASIGITVESESSVFTSGWKDKMGDAEPDKYFVSDYIDYIFKMSGDEYLIGYPDLTGVSAEDFTGDYDGTAHYITVNVPEGVTVKYGTIEGSYTLDSNPGYTDVGTYTVYYQASKDKFIPVSGSATVTIDPINATVTIIGNNDTLNYNEAVQIVTGYKATANVDVYDVEKDFTFSGTAEVSRATVGTTAMGLTSDQFENTNKNFAKVTFLVTDGFLSIVPVDAEVTTAPVEKELEYLESDQELVTEGAAYGGTMLYALGTDETTTPADADFVRRIPTAKESGIYYVWYKVEGDANHNSLPAVCVKSVIADEEWGSLKGVLYQNDGETPLEGATVTLISGNQTVDTVVTKADGIYKFNVPSGVYNIVAEYEGETITVLATVTDETEQDIGMPEANTESILKVNSEDDTAIGVAVGGLDAEARSIRKNDNVPANQTVSVVMTVEAGTGITEEVDSAAAIYAVAANKRLEFFSVKVEKTVDSVTTVLEQTTNVLEIAISYPKTDRHDIALFACHGDEVRTFTESDSRAEGTFRIDKDAGTIFIYTDRFSLFAIGYTPYFTVNSVMTLGSFGGTVDVTLTSEDGEDVFNLKGVTMKDVKFIDIPMGEYTMTVTWKDGAENTLTLPITVSEKEQKASASDASGEDAASGLAAPAISTVNAIFLDVTKENESAAITAVEYDAAPVGTVEYIMVADGADRAKYAKIAFAPATYDFSKSRQKDRFRI